MPSVLSCPVKKWPGSVVLPVALTFEQYSAWTAAIQRVKALGDSPAFVEVDAAFVPAIMAIVAEWRIPALASFTDNGTLPAAPRLSSNKLIAWLVGAISKLVSEADEEDPKD